MWLNSSLACKTWRRRMEYSVPDNIYSMKISWSDAIQCARFRQCDDNDNDRPDRTFDKTVIVISCVDSWQLNGRHHIYLGMYRSCLCEVTPDTHHESSIAYRIWNSVCFSHRNTLIMHANTFAQAHKDIHSHHDWWTAAWIHVYNIILFDFSWIISMKHNDMLIIINNRDSFALARVVHVLYSAHCLFYCSIPLYSILYLNAKRIHPDRLYLWMLTWANSSRGGMLTLRTGRLRWNLLTISV